jgi:hypothetical protein
MYIPDITQNSIFFYHENSVGELIRKFLQIGANIEIPSESTDYSSFDKFYFSTRYEQSFIQNFSQLYPDKEIIHLNEEEIDITLLDYIHLPKLDYLRTTRKLFVDSHAESTRLRFITNGAGQAMEYQESYAQAKVKKANPSAAVPMVAADRKAGMKNPLTNQVIQSDDEAADVIIFMYEQWLLVGAAIREIRLKAKVDIDAATTPEEVEDIFEAAKTQLDAL